MPFQHCRGLVCHSKASAAVARLGNLVEVVALADKFVENPHLLRCYALHNLRIEDAVTGECGEIPVAGLALTLIGLVELVKGKLDCLGQVDHIIHSLDVVPRHGAAVLFSIHITKVIKQL